MHTEPLWNNRNIRYKGQPVYFKTWARVGIKYVQDIWTNGTMLSQEQIVQITGNCPGLTFEYNAIINAMPQVWQRKMHNYAERTEPKKKLI